MIKTEYQRHRDERERRRNLNRIKIASPVYRRICNDVKVLLFGHLHGFAYVRLCPVPVFLLSGLFP